MKFSVLVFVAFLLTSIAAAQTGNGAPGKIHYVMGAVFLQDELVHVSTDTPVVVANGQVLRTDRGRAELLLTTGALIRIGSDSKIEIAEVDDMTTVVHLISGSFIVQVFETKKAGPVLVRWKDAATTIGSKGEFRFDVVSEGPTLLQVRRGRATVLSSQREHLLKKKQMATITSQGVQLARFDDFDADDLTVWHDRRSEIVQAQVFLSRRDTLDLDGLPADPVVFGRRRNPR